MFVDFIYELRKRKVPVGTQEAVALAHALAKDLHGSSLDGFYNVARSLLVHSEAHLDDFDLVFSAYFRGAQIEAKAIAEELYISPATAARHVANIMLKLGFRSRAQIAAWATGMK